MIVNKANISRVFTGLKTEFATGLDAATAFWMKVAMLVNSSTAVEQYAWLAKTGGIREWVGERHIQRLKAYGFQLVNKKFEQTIAISRDDVEDDQTGSAMVTARDMGSNVMQFPDELVFPLLNDGFTSPAYDGQNFFDIAHPVVDADGVEQDVSNFQSGGGAAWFLLDTSGAIMPLVYQLRRAFNFTAKTNLNDDNVFYNDEFVFGVDGRANAGYGLWQKAYASKAGLDATNFDLAVAAMMSVTKDGGVKANIRPTLLVVPPSLRGAANRLIKAETLEAGESNTNFNAVEVLVSPFLT